jgi:hypothetical protein
MLRVIFDTNIYGRLAIEPDGKKIEDRILSEKDFIVYGYSPIRKELRKIPKTTKLSRRNRILLLNLYDKITDNHLLPSSTKVNHLAKKYFDYYHQSGGGYAWHSSIKYDFMIVACASIHGLDIIYSADNKTMTNKTALKSYDHINLRAYYRTPRFLKYEKLIEQFRN